MSVEHFFVCTAIYPSEASYGELTLILKLTTIGCRTKIVANHFQGELSFERLLRVDGSFKGKLASTGDLVVGAKGVVRGNISDLREVRII